MTLLFIVIGILILLSALVLILIALGKAEHDYRINKRGRMQELPQERRWPVKLTLKMADEQYVEILKWLGEQGIFVDDENDDTFYALLAQPIISGMKKQTIGVRLITEKQYNVLDKLFKEWWA